MNVSSSLRIQPVDATQSKLREQRECCIDGLNPQGTSAIKMTQRPSLHDAGCGFPVAHDKPCAVM
ncbi:hypothetical protein, partial [Paraburkholderia sp. GAS334]|uniref:hypothetical protein n=1 Tax=Paraburkholderia sp. GAS334 TaxID=3035131 RepID=UPI003D225CD7